MRRAGENLIRPKVAAPHAVHMSCDHTSFICPREVRRAPRIVVPARELIDMRRLKIMTHLHYCDAHAWDFKPAEYWTDANKHRLETVAHLKWPVMPWKPDFDRSYVEMVLVTTPEYRDFLWELGIRERAAA